MAKNIAFVFPGQGAQYSGMGNDFYNQYEKAKQIYVLSFPMYQMLMQNILIIVVILNHYFLSKLFLL